MTPARWLLLVALIVGPVRTARALPLHGDCLLEPVFCAHLDADADDEQIALAQQLLARGQVAALPLERRVYFGPFPDVIGRRHLEQMQIQLIREMRVR